LRCGHDWHKGATTVVTAEAPAQPTLQSGPNRERYIAKGPKVDGEQIRRPAKSCEAAASPSAEPAKPGETASLTCHPHPLVKPGHPFTLHGEVNGQKWKLECPGLQESGTFELKAGGVRADCRVTVEEES